MNISRLCLVLSIVVGPVVSHAAGKDRAGEAAAPVLMASADPSVTSVSVRALEADKRALSAGTAEALPDLPLPSATAFSIQAALRRVDTGRPQPSGSRLSLMSTTLPETPGVTLLQSSPLASAARRIGAQNFNTEDGSSVNAFAICYRLSKRSSVQVIPGDPAPVKIPVTAMANNMGVTVGMVVRLRK